MTLLIQWHCSKGKQITNIDFEVTEIIILLPGRGVWVCVTRGNASLMYEIENYHKQLRTSWTFPFLFLLLCTWYVLSRPRGKYSKKNKRGRGRKGQSTIFPSPPLWMYFCTLISFDTLIHFFITMPKKVKLGEPQKLILYTVACSLIYPSRSIQPTKLEEDYPWPKRY